MQPEIQPREKTGAGDWENGPKEECAIERLESRLHSRYQMPHGRDAARRDLSYIRGEAVLSIGGSPSREQYTKVVLEVDRQSRAGTWWEIRENKAVAGLEGQGEQLGLGAGGQGGLPVDFSAIFSPVIQQNHLRKGNFLQAFLIISYFLYI